MRDATPNVGSAGVHYFSETLDGTTELSLAAAVVWRGVPTRAALTGGGGPLGWLRGIRHRLWLRLGPLGLDVSVAGRPLFGGSDAWAARGVSSFAARRHDGPLAYYDEGSRTLRLFGRVFPAPPPGQTLVALVDATGRRATAPRLVLRLVPTPTITVERPESWPPPPDDVPGVVYIVGDDPTWAAALREDPVVRAFLDGHAPPSR